MVERKQTCRLPFIGLAVGVQTCIQRCCELPFFGLSHAPAELLAVGVSGLVRADQSHADAQVMTVPDGEQRFDGAVVMGGCVAWSIYVMATGVSPPAAILIPQLSAFAVVAGFERIYPHHRSWNLSRKDIRVDATHSVNIGAMVALVTPLVAAAGVAIAAVP